MWPTIIYGVSLAWLLAVAIATTRCVDLSLVAIESVSALFVTIAICIVIYGKVK